jgi:hypothetical protein
MNREEIKDDPALSKIEYRINEISLVFAKRHIADLKSCTPSYVRFFSRLIYTCLEKPENSLHDFMGRVFPFSERAGKRGQNQG